MISELVEHCETTNVPTVRKGTNESIVTVGLFIFAICMLCISTIPNFAIRAGVPMNSENRTTRAFPKFELGLLKSFGASVEGFYNDRFGFRTELVSIRAWIKYKLYNLSATANVLVGKDGWLFLRGGGGEQTFRNFPPMNDQELRNWATMLGQRKAWCDAHHIQFLFAICPIKATIYREFLPDEFAVVGEKSRADQLIDYLRTNTNIVVVDIRNALKRHKQDGLLFLKRDTHWNRRGAWYGYCAVGNELQNIYPQIRPLDPRSLEFCANAQYASGLPAMMGIAGNSYDSFTEIRAKGTQSWHVSAEPPHPLPLNDPAQAYVPFATDRVGASRIRAFFIRDSFWEMAQPFFSETFNRAFYYRDTTYSFPTTFILKERPDFIVMEMVERSLAQDIPRNPPELFERR